MGEIVSRDGPEQEETMEKMWNSLATSLYVFNMFVVFYSCVCVVADNKSNLMRTDAISGIISGSMTSKNRRVVVCLIFSLN